MIYLRQDFNIHPAAPVTRDAVWSQARERVAALAPERRQELLEPVGPVPEDAIHKAIEESQESPAEAYSFANLDVNPGEMDAFCKLLEMGAPHLPIVASWKPLAGSSSRVIDVWSGDVQQSYAPSNDFLDAFFTPLREIAPREHVVRYFPLPYSPLR